MTEDQRHTDLSKPRSVARRVGWILGLGDCRKVSATRRGRWQGAWVGLGSGEDWKVVATCPFTDCVISGTLPLVKHGRHSLLLLAADAKEMVKDAKVASMGQRLCVAVNTWLEGGRRKEVPAGWFRDAETLVASKYVYAVLAGARCAGCIAPAHSEPTEWLMSLYRKSHAKARMLMLRYSTLSKPRPGDAADQMIRAGLLDRVLDVRLEACTRAVKWECKEYVPAVRAMLPNETKSEIRTYFEQYLSMLEKAYWLDTKEEYGGFMYRVSSKRGYSYARIPKKAFESMSEQEVMKRVREAHEDYRSESGKWLDEINRS